MSFWISGTGAVSCLGLGKEALYQSVLQNKSGINSRGLGPISTENRSLIGESLKEISSQRSLSWPLQISLYSAREAMSEAGWDRLTEKDGLVLATTTGQIPLWERALAQYYQGEMAPSEFQKVFKHYPLGTILDDFSVTINSLDKPSEPFRGPRTLVASACSASTQAMAVACMWLQTGKVERCLVGGIEVLCDLTVEGFRSLKLLSEGSCHPFDAARNGINLSEGAAFFCLEKNKNNSQISVCGYGLSTDSYHMTAPHPEGEGSYVAMKQALQKANLSPQNIDWVHAHGTGSVHNDLSESCAIQRVFGESIPFVSSTKWHHGHALGASGLLEAAISAEGLKKGMMLATHGLATLDEKIKIPIPQEHTKNNNMKYVLKNTLGFGGVNACFIMEKHA